MDIRYFDKSTYTDSHRVAEEGTFTYSFGCRFHVTLRYNRGLPFNRGYDELVRGLGPQRIVIKDF